MDNPAQDLGARSRAGNRMAMVSQAIRLACKAASVVVMARLVPPEQHGLYVMAGAFAVILYLARDLGLVALAVQAPKFDGPQLDSLFRMQLAIGLVISGIAVGGSFTVADFYGEPVVAELIWWLAWVYPLAALGGASRVSLTRSMRLARVSAIETISAVLATIGMIIAGFQGAGPFSFALFWLLNEGLTSAGIFLSAQWRPSLQPGGSLAGLWRQGTTLTVQSMFHYFTSQIDGVIVGRAVGAASAGLYGRAAQIMALPGQHLVIPLGSVMTATLARCKEEPERFIAHATGSFRLCSWLIFPLVATMAALPGAMTRLLLGPDWSGSAAVIPFLAVVAGCNAVNLPLSGLALALGRLPRLLQATAWGVPVLVAAVLISVSHGVTGVAFAVALFHLLSLVPKLLWVLAGAVVSTRAILSAITPALLFSVLIAGTAALGQFMDSWMGELAAGLGLSVLVGATCLWAVPYWRRSGLLALAEFKESRASGHHPAPENR